ncbi:hypothetical protein EV368DRAFT_62046 [Lentinula lateritia]|nr:hypothetical protein EV368DRAFT_62046 [Lentinula lateritia]
MSPIVRPPLVPRILSQHPYRVENEHLAACVRLLESQLASSRQENATLTSALRDTSVSLEARQGELDQLRESISSAAQQQELYDRLLDQVQTLEHALLGPPNESLVDRFRGLEEDLRLARESWAKYLSRFESSNRCNEELETSLVQQQSLVDESNALAVRQRKKIEALQEEVHRFRERALFAEKMIREYPEEGSYSVSLPPLVELALQYMEAAHFIHAELHLRSLSSIQWFFANAAEREEETALPHHGAGNWEDLIPALPSLDRLTQEWEAMMSSYIHFVTDTPLPQVDPQEEGSGHHEEVSALQEGVSGGTAAVPLFLPDPLSPTPIASAASPPSLPPRFGSVANLAINMTADDGDEDIYESPGSIECRNRLEGNLGEDDLMGDGANSSLKGESSVAS